MSVSLAGEDDGVIADINVTPFIDIMLVLLIIFMVTAPLMLGGVHINLPKTPAGQTLARPERPLVLTLDAAGRLFVGREEAPGGDRLEWFRKLALESESGEIFLRGDVEIKYGRMVELMGDLGQAGFARITLVSLSGDDRREAAESSPEAYRTAASDPAL
ncbi:MAG: biopolymer transporter ExbD [Deltaproteobacteria bacterium]|jgi:biopolymer transport protein ExbD|nr:biopolymer transporter ExbD [Deltaproteobacteria bacterium]MDR1309789.1 biopolymer transporter ExbD [Deltaproteobacteria bacterium]